MRFLDYVQTAQTNLTRSKLRTFLTILAILVGTFTLTLTTSVGTGIQQFGEQQLRAQAQPNIIQIFTKFQENGPGGSRSTVQEYNPEKTTNLTGKTSLTQADVEDIKKVANITSADFGYWVNPEYMQRGTGKKYVVAMLESLYPMTVLDFSAGKMPDATDQEALIIPYHYLSPLGFSGASEAVGQSITLRFVDKVVAVGAKTTSPAQQKFLDKTFVIRGVLLDTSVAQAAFIPAQTVADISAFQYGAAQSPGIIVAGITPKLPTADVTTLRKILEDKGYSVFTYQDAIAQFTKAISVVQVGLGAFGGIALIAAMIGIVNTLLMAAYERTQEIGLWKALGMRRRGIFATFLYEALSIGFWGGIMGVLLALGAGTVANRILSRTLLKNVEGFTLLAFRWELMLGIVVLAMAIGLIAGVLPAVRASRLDPIEALRRE